MKSPKETLAGREDVLGLAALLDHPKRIRSQNMSRQIQIPPVRMKGDLRREIAVHPATLRMKNP